MLDAPPRVGLPIDPRIQARLLEVRRDGRRGRRRLLVSAGVLTALLLVAWGAARSPLLAVRHVQVSGTGPTTRAAALVAAGLDRHHQMLDLRLGQMRQRLEALPWVDRAVVSRHWPSRVGIALTSRVPAAQMPGPEGKPAVIDARGRVLAVGAEAATVLSRPGTHLPRMTGIGAAGASGTVLGPGSRPALTFAATIPPALLDLPSAVAPAGGLTVDAITAAPGPAWSALLSSGISVVFGSPDQLADKLVAMRTILARASLAGVATIDVRVPDTPVLTRGTRATIFSTIPRG